MYQPHYSVATDSRIVQTRQALQAAFLQLLADRALADITIRDIAATAGVGYNTFFRHYTSKESLLNEMAVDEISDLIELCMSVLDASESQDASRALCRYVLRHDALWSTLLNGGAADMLRETFTGRLRELAVDRVTSKGAFPAEIGIRLVAAGTIEILSWWLAQERRMAVEEIAEIYDQLVVGPSVKAYRGG